MEIPNPPCTKTNPELFIYCNYENKRNEYFDLIKSIPISKNNTPAFFDFSPKFQHLLLDFHIKQLDNDAQICLTKTLTSPNFVAFQHIPDILVGESSSLSYFYDCLTNRLDEKIQYIKWRLEK